MKKLFLLAIGVIFLLTAEAQQDAASIKEKDSAIMSEIIMPALNQARADHTDPSWDELSGNIRTNYGDYFAERMPLKAKIYYYYENNPAEFTKAIIKFTEKYEDKDNLKLMNKNAGYILKYSTDKSELQIAATWSKHTVDKDPTNETYQATYKNLQEKLK